MNSKDVEGRIDDCRKLIENDILYVLRIIEKSIRTL